MVSTRSIATDRSPSGGSLLTYTPKAGLLPELSRQTYDQLYKALRETVLNGMDAGASVIHLDFRETGSARRLIVEDDGHGMSAAEFRADFMGLGGSRKFGTPGYFGRIGIGSLALLHYAQRAVVETKVAGSHTVVYAELTLDWSDIDRTSNVQEVPAGHLREEPYPGSADDHFTRIHLEQVQPQIAALASDPSDFYALIDKLRLVLPLPLPDGPLLDQLRTEQPDLEREIRSAASHAPSRVEISGPWDDHVPLTRRYFGDGSATSETWTGYPVAFHESLRLPSPEGRTLTVTGFLIAQEHATPKWSGVTARVHNVAVEERTFFDIDADPGFRKYITGELWIRGDVATDRLINIDRTSFNRECVDYLEIRRSMTNRLTAFKSQAVQRTQRAKVAVRRLVRDHQDALALAQTVATTAHRLTKASFIPPSPAKPRPFPQTCGLADLVRDTGAELRLSSDDSTAIEGTSTSWAPIVRVPARLLASQITFGPCTYRMHYCAAGGFAVLVRNRPRRIIFNLAHKRHDTSTHRPRALATSFALELAFLLANSYDSADMYEMLSALLDVS